MVGERVQRKAAYSDETAVGERILGSVSATLIHSSGAMTEFIDAGGITRLVAELDASYDPEHSGVAVVHETGWSLSAFPAGLVVWDSVEGDDDPRHRVSVARAELVDMLTVLAHGDLTTIEAGPWLPGNGPGPAPPTS